MHDGDKAELPSYQILRRILRLDLLNAKPKLEMSVGLMDAL